MDCGTCCGELMPMSSSAVIHAKHLTIEYRIQKQWRNVVNGVDLSINPGEIHGLVGESGSGKSTLAFGLMRFLASNARISDGSITFAGSDLLAVPQSELSRFWGGGMTMVPQSPMDSLNPSIRIGKQLAEATQHHLGLSAEQARSQAEQSLATVQIADPDRVLTRYPHQLSGGMLQRVMIALALSTRPQLVVLDEPTTALDVTTQAVILTLVRDLVHEEQAAGLYVSHDLGTIAQVSDRVTVLYAGEVMESADVSSLFHAPRHPYTFALLACLPSHAERGGRHLATIPGFAPSLFGRSAACVFADRCPVATEQCRTTKPPLEQSDDGRLVRCWRWREIDDGSLGVARVLADYTDKSAPAANAESAGAGEPDVADAESVLTVSGLSKRFGEVRIFDRLLGKQPEYVQAVDDVSISLLKQKTFGLVGESGSGKTTLARAIVGLNPADEGEMQLLDFQLSPSLSDRRHDALQRIRMVFQNPSDALNPHHTVGETIGRTIRKLGAVSGRRIEEAVEQQLESVGLPGVYRYRLPSQLSGGEKQRVAIARAFAAEPAVVVADEPTSALDVSVQAVILNLLKELRSTNGSSYLFISHDLEVIAYLADWIAVMYLGSVVEQGSNSDVLQPPWHPYTEALLKASPIPDPDAAVERVGLEGEVPSPRNKPSGCPFHTRCPRFIGDICVNKAPLLRESADGHQIRCHHPLDELEKMQGESK